VHFYHLHALDWVDVVSATKADPAATAKLARSVSAWSNNSETWFRSVQDRVKAFVAGGQLGIFTNGYWGHPGYKLPPEANLLAVAHYLEALDWQRDVVRVHTIFGGKNPHPNFLVGGMACAINLSDTATINAERLTTIKAMIDKALVFVEQAYWPDLLAIASFYKDWGAIGGGVKNHLTVGEFPQTDIREPQSYYFPAGIILENDLSRVWPYEQDKVKEYITSSWYEGETKAKYTGPPPPWKHLQGLDKYTWMKAPRYDGRPMQVGPLARMLVAYASGHDEARVLVKEVLDRLEVGPAALFSTLGRTAARGIETVLLARRLSVWFDQLVTRIGNGDVATFSRDRWEPSTWPKECQGYGHLDAPRGALGHWVQIRDEKIARYQCVVPSTWNCSPRDAQGQLGPYEAALVDNHPLVNSEQPLEILRTIHSFDPCMACGVHVLDATGQLVTKVQVQ
jgi:hydrogenase large subunit